MKDKLLEKFYEELTYLKHKGAIFAKEYPKIAGRLLVGDTEAVDPQVEHLIQAVAFLNARIREKLDDEFPELTKALLEALYPHYLAPIPSMSIIQLQAKTAVSATIPAESMVEMKHADMPACPFQTRYPVDLVPLKITDVTFHLLEDATSNSSATTALLKVNFSTTSPTQLIQQIDIKKLRLYLNGASYQTHKLYELLFRNCTQVKVINDAKQVLNLDPKNFINPVGFIEDEKILPFSSRSFEGYRLLTEFFAFPQKFMFIDLIGLTPEKLKEFDNTHNLTIEFYFKDQAEILSIKKDFLLLNCTPIINIFHQRAEPIKRKLGQTQYQLVPNARQTDCIEVHTVKKVTAISSSNTSTRYWPLYGIDHSLEKTEQQCFWDVVRDRKIKQNLLVGYDTSITFIDSLDESTDWVMQVEALCTNGDLPSQKSSMNSEISFQLDKAPSPIAVKVIVPPTASIYHEDHGDRQWRLVSHLSLNHLSLVQSVSDTIPLKEILKLYCYNEFGEHLINGIKHIERRSTLIRNPSAGPICFLNGTEVIITFDSAFYPPGMLFLFTQILSKFLNMYCSINSFVKLSGRLDKEENNFYEWTPEIGELCLV